MKSSVSIQTVTPCLWFDDQAEPAAEFYTGIFRNSKITKISRYGEAGAGGSPVADRRST